jgi:hypothetical protein
VARGRELAAEQAVFGIVLEALAEMRPHRGLVPHLDDASHDAVLLEGPRRERGGRAHRHRLRPTAGGEQSRLAPGDAEKSRCERRPLAHPRRRVVLQQPQYDLPLAGQLHPAGGVERRGAHLVVGVVEPGDDRDPRHLAADAAEGLDRSRAH